MCAESDAGSLLLPVTDGSVKLDSGLPDVFCGPPAGQTAEPQANSVSFTTSELYGKGLSDTMLLLRPESARESWQRSYGIEWQSSIQMH